MNALLLIKVSNILLNKNDIPIRHETKNNKQNVSNYILIQRKKMLYSNVENVVVGQSTRDE